MLEEKSEAKTKVLSSRGLTSTLHTKLLHMCRQREANDIVLSNAMAMGMTDQGYRSRTTGSLILPLSNLQGRPNYPLRNELYMTPPNAYERSQDFHSHINAGAAVFMQRPPSPQYVPSQPDKNNEFYAEIPGEYYTSADNQPQDEYVNPNETKFQSPSDEKDNKTEDKASEKPDTPVQELYGN